LAHQQRAIDDALFFVAEADATVVGTVLAGYDRHRSWIYSLAVHSDHRRRASDASCCAQRRTPWRRAAALKSSSRPPTGTPAWSDSTSGPATQSTAASA